MLLLEFLFLYLLLFFDHFFNFPFLFAFPVFLFFLEGNLICGLLVLVGDNAVENSFEGFCIFELI